MDQPQTDAGLDATNADARQNGHQAAWGPANRTTLDAPVAEPAALSGRWLAPNARNHELAADVKQLRGKRNDLRSRAAAISSPHPVEASSSAPAGDFLTGDEERRRLERDLHDGVQNELVALIVELTLVAEDRGTPPALAGTLSALAARAEATLDSVREIARGIYPSQLAAFGIAEALRAPAARASIDVSLGGTVPRSADEVEAAVYFSCLEAIQNVAKHAGQDAQAAVRLQHDHRTLAVRIEDRGCGFDPAHTPKGAGLTNIHTRIETLGGAVMLTSTPGHGTVLSISLPWPARQPEICPTDLPAVQSRQPR